MKVIDVESLLTAVSETQISLSKQNEQLAQIEQVMNSFTSLYHSFQGEATEAVRTYYTEYHQPLLKLFQQAIQEYQNALHQLNFAIQSLEPTSNGHIHQQFLDMEVNQSLEQTRYTLMYLTDRANSVMQRVTDIVMLPRIQDDEFHMHVSQAKKHVIETSERLMHFDYEQSSSLQSVEESIYIMSRYIQMMSSMFIQQGVTVSSFFAKKMNKETSFVQMNEALNEQAR